MIPGQWWRQLTTKKSRRFPWSKRNTMVAEPILKMTPHRFVAKGVELMSDCLIYSETVSRLPDCAVPTPSKVTTVNLQSSPGKSNGIHYVLSSSSHTNLSGSNVRPALRDDGPTLVERLRLILAISPELLLPGPDTVLDWPGALMPFQIEGVHELINRDKILLADDMGLGKTLQTIAAIRILLVTRDIESALVVAPASLLDQWSSEFSKWAPELRTIIIRGTPAERALWWTAQVHICLISYETLLADFTDNPQSPPRRKIWDLVVLDEAQRIKNRNETSRAVKQLQRRRSWALTGTPLENEVEELASIIEFVDQGETTSTRFYRPGPELLQRHRELQLRRKKSEVLDQLPPKRVTKIAVSLLPKQRESYDRAEREGTVHLRQLGSAVRIQHVLELITRLKQICNADPETGESAKLNDIRERLANLARAGNRAIIFSQYTDDVFGVNGVANAIRDSAPLTFTGDMSSGERNHIIQLFKSNNIHKALVLSLKAGGVGLNLQEASYVFHLDRWWNPAIERQAEDRSHRYGQVVPVNVFKYVCTETIEERIDAILEQKQRLFNELIDDVTLDVGSRFSLAELWGLFGLDSPTTMHQEPKSRQSGLELEERCARILNLHGWTVQRTPASYDGGVDVIGSRSDEVGIEEEIFVQCKDHARPVGVSVIRELLGSLPAGERVRPVLAAPCGVTPGADQLAKQRGVIIWDEAKLRELESVA